MKLKTLILTLLAISTSANAGQERQVSKAPLSKAAFDKVDPGTLNAATILYSENILSFADWVKNSPDESRVMNMYEGFVEPKVSYTNSNGQPDELIDYITMYNVRTKTVLNTSAAKANLKQLIDLPTINSIETSKPVDPNAPLENQVMVSKQIAAADLVHNKLAAGKPIDNFAWCNKKNADDIVKPSKETDLKYIGGKAWCTASDRSICVESCYLFGTVWRAGITGEAAARATKNASANALDSLDRSARKVVGLVVDVAPKPVVVRTNRREDFGVATQSEIRYFVSEAEYGSKVELNKLTRIPTPIRGVIEQTSFYFNQVFKFSKVLTVVHEHPTDSEKSIMVNLVAMGVRTHSWKKPMLPDHLKGEGLWNDDTGLAAGIPWFTQNITKRVAEILEAPPK